MRFHMYLSQESQYFLPWPAWAEGPVNRVCGILPALTSVTQRGPKKTENLKSVIIQKIYNMSLFYLLEATGSKYRNSLFLNSTQENHLFGDFTTLIIRPTRCLVCMYLCSSQDFFFFFSFCFLNNILSKHKVLSELT